MVLPRGRKIDTYICMGQLLLAREFQERTTHGGSLATGKRKVARPLALKRPMHLVLKSRHSTLLKHGAMVRRLLQNMSDLQPVTVYEFSVNSNHVHLLLRAKTRKGFQGFLRVFCGQVAQKISGARKGQKLRESFWHVPVFSRIIAWGKAFVSARRYVVQNQLEATGEIPYRSRNKRLVTLDGS